MMQEVAEEYARVRARYIPPRTDMPGLTVTPSTRAHSGIGTGEVRCMVAVQVVPTEARMIMAIALH